jgi:hypothetical protein
LPVCSMSATPQARCPQCKQQPIRKGNKETTCALCQSKWYCSAACLQAGKRAHLRECPQLGCGYFLDRSVPTMEVAQRLVHQGRAVQGEECLLRLIQVGRNVRKKERDHKKVGGWVWLVVVVRQSVHRSVGRFIQFLITLIRPPGC